MTQRVPVELVFRSRPFDEGAVRHTLRHLAARVGWQLVPHSAHRIIYLTEDGEVSADARGTPPPVVIRSSPEVARHLRDATTPLPLAQCADGLLPFPQAGDRRRPGWIDADVVAGAHAALNLWFEQQSKPVGEDGWITWEQDWMARVGLPDPRPLADEWLDRIYAASLEVGWPNGRAQENFAVVLTHDVDYLPGAWDLGLPRLARTLYRQAVTRARPADALRVAWRYLAAVGRVSPYLEVARIVDEERRRNARSSFQFVVSRTHASDPHYARYGLGRAAPPEPWEICLHGSYLASRRRGQLAAERQRLESLSGRRVLGHRQHYLNFDPAGLFREVDAAGLCYDMSVGYNDRSGPRAATYFPFRPYDLDAGQPHAFWEIPFVLMDTTLATSYQLGPRQALEHAQSALRPAIAAGGCVSIIWHQEQCGGLLDPGYDRVYADLLDWLAAAGARLVNGSAVVGELDAVWEAAGGGVG